MLYLGFKNPYKKNGETRISLCGTENEGRKPDKN
jgi:hypothetical protein